MLSFIDDVRAAATREGFRALNSVAIPMVKAGLGTPLPIGVGLVVLETTGRVSGETREVPLLAARVLDTIHVSTVRSGSQWTRNLVATPEAAVWVGGRRRSATAAVDRGRLAVASLSLD